RVDGHSPASSLPDLDRLHGAVELEALGPNITLPCATSEEGLVPVAKDKTREVRGELHLRYFPAEGDGVGDGFAGGCQQPLARADRPRREPSLDGRRP